MTVRVGLFSTPFATSTLPMENFLTMLISLFQVCCSVQAEA